MIPRTSVKESIALGLAEVEAMTALLRSLGEADWAKPTDCAGWSVHDVVSHVVGQFEGAARPARMVRRIRAARRMGGSVLDAHNRIQVQERRHIPSRDLIGELERWGERGVKTLGRMPSPLRRMRLSRMFPEAVEMNEDSLDYLIRVIGPRDPWMHRIDVATATGRTIEPTEHDLTIVAQVIRDVGERWEGPAVRLGEFVIGHGSFAAEINLDPIGFCRLVSGRPAPKPAISGDATIAARLLAVRVAF